MQACGNRIQRELWPKSLQAIRASQEISRIPQEHDQSIGDRATPADVIVAAEVFGVSHVITFGLSTSRKRRFSRTMLCTAPCSNLPTSR